MKSQLMLRQSKHSPSISTLDITTFDLHEALFFYKSFLLRQHLLIPDAFIEELEDFSRGNSLAFLGNDEHHHEVHACCIRCIKAYALQRAREKNFSLSLLHFFDQFFEGEIGHEGYYIDQGKIVKY